MFVIDLFSGLGGWSQAFLDRGHDVLRIDNDRKFRDIPNTVIGDVGVFEFRRGADVVLASPPCEGFSVAALGHSWSIEWDCTCGGVISRVGKARGGDRQTVCSACSRPRKSKGTRRVTPVTDTARLGVELVGCARRAVRAVGPRYWWMENPRAALRKLPVVHGLDRVTVTYCHYGENRMKPTDLWGVWPETWHPQPACNNGDPCHEAASRGSPTGTQGIKGAANKAKIPYALSLEVCLAVEEAFEKGDVGAYRSA